jgi:hypothetical protein
VAAAELQDSFSKVTDRFRVFYREALYRQRAASEVGPGGLTIGGRGQGLGCAPWW